MAKERHGGPGGGQVAVPRDGGRGTHLLRLTKWIRERRKRAVSRERISMADCRNTSV